MSVLTPPTEFDWPMTNARIVPSVSALYGSAAIRSLKGK